MVFHLLVNVLAGLLLILPGIHCYGYDHHTEWGYDGDNGCGQWKGDCQNHTRQSPINIEAEHIDCSLMDPIYFVNYDVEGELDFTNTGRTLLATGFGQWNNKQPVIFGGGLKHNYKLVQFHIHWGQNDSVGSEHAVESKKYHAEIHLVHVREDMPTETALTQPDGIAVVGVFVLVEDDTFSHGFEGISKKLDLVKKPETYTNLTRFRPSNLLPNNIDAFFRYEGSLTTPNCSEAVIWTIFENPLKIGRQQLDLLRLVENAESVKSEKNYRPLQKLNGRRIIFRTNATDRHVLCSAKSSFSGFLVVAVVFIISTIL